MFYCREKELKILEEILKESNRAVAIYGKRRVGKTSLILNMNKNNKLFIYFECIQDTLETNISSFVDKCKKAGIDFPIYFKANSFIDIFSYLDSLNKQIIVTIDEYPFLKKLCNSYAIDSAFQNVIDNHIKNIDLIISGSEIKMMEEILNEKNPLFGRFYQTIYLDEMNYLDVSNFYINKSVIEKIAFYSIFGGSPFINDYINPALGLKENIINTFLKIGSGVYNYADSILISDVVNEIHAKRILSFLKNGKKKHKDIIDVLDEKKTGVINRSLNSLVELKLIKKTVPINKKGDPKKGYYEISDNVLRFYYAFIYKNVDQLQLIGAEQFFDEYIFNSLNHYISFRFEEQCRMYFSILANQGNLKGVKAIGTYYYDDKENKENGEFDVALQINNGFDIYEVKYLKQPFDELSAKKEIEQIRKIKEIQVKNIGFISANGFDFIDDNLKLITGNNLYFVDK